ncbi:MAG: AAA family ATPase [Pyrinomonadaceae bacterium]|nr:AAA family ATPase [Pyrinomonadaceae bacterium]
MMEDLDDDFDDSSRYDSAYGYRPPDHSAKWARLRERIRKNDSTIYQLPFETLAGGEIGRAKPRRRPAELFGPLWREGEVALLFGGQGIGKSLFAVQLAESIARARGGRGVHYLDFERTAAQFAERYTLRGEGGRPLTYRFAKNFHWSGIDPKQKLPDSHQKDRYAFLRECVVQFVHNNDVEVLIIDNLSALVRTLSGSMGQRLMRMLKLATVVYGVSILAVSSAKPSRRVRPATVADLPGGHAMADAADSVFAICRSTMAEDIRYLKHLKSRSGPVRFDENCVAAYRLGRLDDPPARALELSDPDAAPPADARMLRLAAAALGHAADHPEPGSGSNGAFLGLQLLGYSAESEHLRDYQAEALAAHQSHQKRLRRSPNQILIDAILDGSYAKYLND